MTFLNRFSVFVMTIVLVIFLSGASFLLGVRYENTKSDHTDILSSHFNLHNLSGPIQNVGNEYIFYTVYCGSSCKGLFLVRIPTGEVYKATLSYPFDHAEQKDYALFTDWHSNDFELDDLFDQVTATVHGNTAVLTFTNTDKQTTSQSIAIDIEN